VAKKSKNITKKDLSVDRPWARWLLVTAAILVALAFLYPQQFFGGEIFLSSDSSNAEAFTTVGNEALEDGTYPLWNPYLFGGMPTFGSVAYVRFLYPPTAFFNFIQQYLGFQPLTWLFGHMLMGGLGMAWLLSRWKLPVGALVLGAIIWILYPKVVAWGVHGHGSKLGAAMYMPWIVGWTLRVLDGRGMKAMGMLALLMGMQLLRGHPQITYYTLMMVGWLSLLNTVLPFEEANRKLAALMRWKRLGQVVLGLGVGFLIGGIMLVPVQNYSGLSIRGQDTDGGGGVGLDYATDWSFSPLELPTFIFPSASGFGQATYVGPMPFNDYPNYLGILLLVLAAASFSKSRRNFMVAIGSMVLLALLVSFGKHGLGLYKLFYQVMPFFNKFRVPSMILIIPAFAVALLVPRTIQAWIKGKWPGGNARILPAILGSLGLVILMGGVSAVAEGPYISSVQQLAENSGKGSHEVLLDAAWLLHRADLIRVGLILLCFAAALWFSINNRIFREKGLVWVLVLLVAVDLLGTDHRIVNPEQSLQQVVRTANGGARLAPATKLSRKPMQAAALLDNPGGSELAALVGHHRIWPLSTHGKRNTFMADGVRSLGGYHAAKLASYEPIRSRLLDGQAADKIASWLDGRFVLVDQKLDGPNNPVPVVIGSSYIYTNEFALPRARLLTQWALQETLPEKDKLEPFLDGIQAGEIDVAGMVYLDQTPNPMPGEAQSALPEPVFMDDGLNEVILSTKSPVPALLLLSDMMVPGWSVEVDGQESTLLVADLVLRAVALPAGEHTVRFYFSDPSVKAGLSLTLTGLLIAFALVFAETILRRKPFVAKGDASADE
jgi:hypothetical protein